jgi:HAD superfamily hydrolase (TIGR01509 family)
MSIKLIVVDMGKVFVDYDHSQVRAMFSDRTGVSETEIRSALHSQNLSLLYERGQVTTEAFLSQINESFRLISQKPDYQPLSITEFETLWVHSFTEVAEMTSFLDVLRQRYPLVLLSNTNDAHWRYLQDTYNVSRLFREMVLSFREGLTKPDPLIYQRVLDVSESVLGCSLSPAECVLIDDLQPNIESAQRFGMNTILFDGIDQADRGVAMLQTKLQELGVTV